MIMNTIEYTPTYYVSYRTGSSVWTSGFFMIVSLLSIVMFVIGLWKTFEKADRPGWLSLIPFYNMYVLFDIVFGDGLKFLLLLVPIYNIYITFKLYIELAHLYGESTLFGVGLAVINPVFICVLGCGGAKYSPDGEFTESFYSEKPDESVSARDAALAKIRAKQKERNEHSYD